VDFPRYLSSAQARPILDFPRYLSSAQGHVILYIMTRAEGALLNAWIEMRDHNPVERTRRNDHPRIDHYLTRARTIPNQPWCAAFVNHNCLEAGFDWKELPSQPAAVRFWASWGNRKGIVTSDPAVVRRGDLFYWLNKNGTGHIGHIAETKFVDKPGIHDINGNATHLPQAGWWIRCYEGNATDDPSVREGVKIVHRWRFVGSNIRFIRLTRV
jgi:hypothetical protein